MYTVPWISVFADAGNDEYDYPIAPGAPGRPTVNFTNGRICAELGDTPWSPPLLRAPRAAIPLMSFDRPPPPPNYAEVGNLDDKSAGIATRWWGHHLVTTAPRSPYATAGRLWDDGYGLTVYLRP